MSDGLRNPFETPKVAETELDPRRTSSSEDERIRREHLSHEASIQGVGGLWLLGGIFVSLGALATMTTGTPNAVPIGIIQALMAAGLLWTGWVLRRLDGRGRIPGTIFAALGLFAVPIGTLISAYILYLLNSKKATVIFSEQYRGIRARTPHIVYRTSIVVWICLGLLLILLGVGLFMALKR